MLTRFAKSFPVTAILFSSFFIVLIFPLASWPQESTTQDPPLQSITLKDGTVLKGYLKAVEGDHYIIQSTQMGQISIPASGVTSMTPISAGNQDSSQASNSSPLQGVTQDVQNKYLKDPDILSDAQDLAKDPEFMSLMMDPTFLQALMSKDPAQLQNHPSMQKIMQNPKMKEIMDKIRQKMESEGGS